MTDNQQHEDGKRERSGGLTVAVIVLLVVPAVYLFATGPIIWLIDRNYISDDAHIVIAYIYKPLAELEEHCGIVRRIMEAWYSLWQQ